MQTYIPGTTPVPDGLATAIKAGVPVRILLLDPHTAIAKQRMEDIGFDGNTQRFDTAIETLRKSLWAFQGLKPVEVRFHTSLPQFSMFAADDFLLLGLH
jgi:hypothetical protein